MLDIALTTTNEVCRPQMNIHIIRRSSLHFFTNSYHKLAENPAVPVEEFKDTPLIPLKENTYQYKAVEALFHAHGCEPNVIHTTNQLATTQHFVRSGLSSYGGNPGIDAGGQWPGGDSDQEDAEH